MLQCTPLHCNSAILQTLHCLHCTWLYFVALYCTTLHCISLHFTLLHSIHFSSCISSKSIISSNCMLSSNCSTSSNLMCAAVSPTLLHVMGCKVCTWISCGAPHYGGRWSCRVVHLEGRMGAYLGLSFILEITIRNKLIVHGAWCFSMWIFPPEP